MRLKRDPATVLRPHQWANDWIMAEEVHRPLSPLSVILDPEDVPRFEADREAFRRGESHSGRFWVDYRLEDDGTFAPTDAESGSGGRTLRVNARREGR